MTVYCVCLHEDEVSMCLGNDAITESLEQAKRWKSEMVGDNKIFKVVVTEVMD